MAQTPVSNDLPARHEADRAAVDRVRRDNFGGPHYDALIADLYRYAWPVMLSKIRTGDVASIPTGVPHRGISPDEQQLLHDSSQEREDLALASISRAMEKFRATLQAGRWDPDKGRSLRSYFIGACAQAFWNEFARWRVQRRAYLNAVTRMASTYNASDEHACTVEEHLGRRQAVDVLLARAQDRSPELEAIMRCLLNGRTASEAASELGYSARAVEGRLYQFRKTAWGLVRSGRIDPSLVPGSRAQIAARLAGTSQ
jgi:DNA-directed RNA polymerase specialized sigma24 family protein